jgi:hypothetical protein
MTQALIHDKVDNWLAQHKAWVNASADRQALAAAWHKVACEYGADHPAALGILRALVREAWGDPEMCFLPCREDGMIEWRALYRYRNVRPGQSEDEALMLALDAAPIERDQQCG